MSKIFKKAELSEEEKKKVEAFWKPAFDEVNKLKAQWTENFKKDLEGVHGIKSVKPIYILPMNEQSVDEMLSMFDE